MIDKHPVILIWANTIRGIRHEAGRIAKAHTKQSKDSLGRLIFKNANASIAYIKS